MQTNRTFNQLAKVYLDDKNNHKAKRVNHNIILYILAAINISLTIFLLSKIPYSQEAKKSFVAADKKSIFIATKAIPLRISSAQPRLTLDVNNINLKGYEQLELSVRYAKEKSMVESVNIQLETAQNEKSSFSLHGITANWRIFSVPLKEFKEIRNSSDIKNISFQITDRAKNKEAIVYIDEINFNSLNK